MTEPDLDSLRQWIGRGEEARDLLTERLVESLNATLNRTPGTMPLGLHWCLAPSLAATRDLAADGLPARGGFLPPVPLPLRMWAGGQLDFHDEFQAGDNVIRRSSVSDVTLKEGRSGPLCFVTVAHDHETARGSAVTERQDIVYRTAATGTAPSPPAEMPHPEWTESVMADSTLLFRYSALTFNGHRIHLDREYCREEEGYPDLLVHGPLQATFLMNLGRDIMEDRPPRSFAYRALMPLYDRAEFSVNAARAGDGLTLWAADSAGRPTMTAEMTW